MQWLTTPSWRQTIRVLLPDEPKVNGNRHYLGDQRTCALGTHFYCLGADQICVPFISLVITTLFNWLRRADKSADAADLPLSEHSPTGYVV